MDLGLSLRGPAIGFAVMCAPNPATVLPFTAPFAGIGGGTGGPGGAGAAMGRAG